MNARVALRLVRGWSQREAAEQWNRRWPAMPKTFKNFSYWELWPSHTGHAPSLDVLTRLAELYECRVADLLSDCADFRAADPAWRRGRADERAPRPAAGDADQPSASASPPLAVAHEWIEHLRHLDVYEIARLTSSWARTAPDSAGQMAVLLKISAGLSLAAAVGEPPTAVPTSAGPTGAGPTGAGPTGAGPTGAGAPPAAWHQGSAGPDVRFLDANGSAGAASAPGRGDRGQETAAGRRLAGQHGAEQDSRGPFEVGGRGRGNESAGSADAGQLPAGFSGVWRSRCVHPDDWAGRSVVDEHYVAFRQEGRRLAGESVATSDGSRLRLDLELSGQVATGTWAKHLSAAPERPSAVHHGVVQLVVDRGGRSMSGRWAGFDHDWRVSSNVWELSRVDEAELNQRLGQGSAHTPDSQVRCFPHSER